MANNHEFESWFSDSREFEKLSQRKCQSVYIVLPNKFVINYEPYGLEQKNEKIFDDFNNKLNKEKKELIKIRAFIEKNFEFAGNLKRVRDLLI